MLPQRALPAYLPVASRAVWQLAPRAVWQLAPRAVWQLAPRAVWQLAVRQGLALHRPTVPRRQPRLRTTVQTLQQPRLAMLPRSPSW